MTTHPVRRLSATALAISVWIVLAATAAQAKVGPEDPDTAFITQPAVVTAPSVSWTHDALVAGLACLIGVAVTFALLLVLRPGHDSHDSHESSVMHA